MMLVSISVGSGVKQYITVQWLSNIQNCKAYNNCNWLSLRQQIILVQQFRNCFLVTNATIFDMR